MSRSLGTFVDSSVLLDVFTEDPVWGEWSSGRLLEAAGRGPIVLNAVVLAEVSPRFTRLESLEAALPSLAVVEEMPWAAAFLAGHAHAAYRRAGGERRAVLPDFLIGAHAAVTDRPLLTRDSGKIASYIPGAKLITAERPEV